VCVLHLCSVFLDVYYVPCRSYLNTCVRVCHSFHGPLRQCLEPGASGLPYYCTTICVRSCCNWRASCVDSTIKKKTEDERLEMVIGMQNEILIGIMKLLFEVSFHLKFWKETYNGSFLIPIRISFCIPMTIPSLIFHGTGCMCCEFYWRNYCSWIWLVWWEPPEEGRGVEFPRKSAILAECTTNIGRAPPVENKKSENERTRVLFCLVD